MRSPKTTDAKGRLARRCIAALGLLAVCAGMAFGQNCDNPATVAELTECATLRLRAAQRELDAQLKLLAALEDENLRAAVLAAQQAWKEWVDKEGEVASLATNDQALALSNKHAVQAQLTEDRVRDLRTHTGQ